MPKPVKYALEIYKPSELQAIPGTDECRHYHSDTPFPAVHVGDLVSAWAWKFPGMSLEDLQREMGGQSPEPMRPVAIVEKVMHSIVDGVEATNYTVIVFTKLYTAPKSCPLRPQREPHGTAPVPG